MYPPSHGARPVRRRALLGTVPLLLAWKAGLVGLTSENNILAGNSLARAQIQSPDYVPGVSGWAIFQNGNAEFNDGTFRGNVVDGGTFVYSGAPGPGNPPIAWLSDAAEDPYGNVLPFQGIVTQNASGYMGMSGDQLSWSNGTYITGSVSDQLVLGGTPGTNAIEPLLPFSAPLVAVEPGTTATAETWHNITSGFPAGVTGQISYRVMADGVNVELDFDLAVTGGTSLGGGTFMANLSAGSAWWPAAAKYYAIQSNQGGNWQPVTFDVDGSGNIHARFAATTAIATLVGNAIYPLGTV